MSARRISSCAPLLLLLASLSGCTMPAPKSGACPLATDVCSAVVAHCEDLSTAFDKARSFAIGGEIGVASLEVRYEEKRLVSDEYLALRGMAYFSCAAFQRGDISHREYVDSLFPIAAIAEAVGKYLASDENAKKIQDVMASVTTKAASLENGATDARLLEKYQNLRQHSAVEAYADRLAKTAKRLDEERALPSEQISELRTLLTDKVDALTELHAATQPTPDGRLWFRAFVLERQQDARLNDIRFAGIDERFRRIEREQSGTEASHVPDELNARFELVAAEALDIESESPELDSEALRRVKSLCRSFAIWPYRVFVFGQGKDEAVVNGYINKVVAELKSCGFPEPGKTYFDYNTPPWIRVMVIAECYLGTHCIREQAG